MKRTCVRVLVTAWAMVSRRLLMALLILSSVAPGASACGRQSQEPLRVLAAQSLVDAFTAMGAAFERAHPDVRVELTTASSGQLRAQVEAGAPADVFASASQHHMDLLAEQKLIVPDGRLDFAGNRMVLIAPKGSSLTAPAELTRADVRHVAIGDWSHVPAGRYARQVLERHSLLEPLKPKLRRCQHVRQVLTYVAAGEVEAGLVFRTDAAREPERVEVVWTAPPADHTAIRLPIATLAKSGRPAEARRFVAFVTSAAGQAIMKEHGFVVPAPDVSAVQHDALGEPASPNGQVDASSR